MSNKTPKAKHKNSDDIPSQPSADEDSKHLLTRHKPVLVRPITVQGEEDDDSTPSPDVPASPVEPAPLPPKDDAESPADEVESVTLENPESSIPETPETSPAEAPPATTVPEETPPVADQAPSTPDADVPPATAPASPAAADAQPDTDKLPTKKTLDDAVKEAERQRETEKYINNHEYFVPIKPTAQQRSIMVSIILVIILFLLALILVDLLLDSGAILLLQKIPHTHFFTSGN